MTESIVRREIVIHARRETVFRFFTESPLFAKWWGDGSTIDARVGGAVLIQYPNGVKASGEVREIVPGERVVFTFGYESGKPCGPGETVVAMTFADAPSGTRVTLTHECPTPEIRDMHVPGWRYQMAVFAKVAADEELSDAASTVDRWFAAWSETDPAKQRELLTAATDDDVEFRDAWGLTKGVDDLLGHIAAARMHLGSATLKRTGEVRRSHGVALADFLATKPDGSEAMSGTNVFRFSPDGRIAEATGVPISSR